MPSPSLQGLLLPEAFIQNSKLALQACCTPLKIQSELGYPALCMGAHSSLPSHPLLFNIIINGWEAGVESKLSRFVVYSKFLQVVSCHTDDSRRTSQKFMGKRVLLLKGIGKDTPLWSLAQDCHGCSGKMSPCQVALTRACSKRCILSLTYFLPTPWWCLLQGALKAFLSHVFPSPSAASTFIFERVCLYFFHLSTNFLRLPCLNLPYLLQ